MRSYAIPVSALCIFSLAAAAPVPLTLDLNSKGTQQGLLIGGGIEDVNHELYGGLYSQMIFGESFEEPPSREHISGGDVFLSGDLKTGLKPTWSRGATGWYSISKDAFNGKQSQSVTNGSVLNFGLGQQGMYFKAGAGLDYTGHVYAKVQQRATVTVRLISTTATANVTELAATSFKLGASAEWTLLNFQLVPSMATFCDVTQTPRGSTCVHTPELNSSCYQCSGGLEIQVEGGPVLLDMVFLQPGEWGRYQGLPVRRDVAEAMFSLAGWQVVRLGGSMCTAGEYLWKHFRGPRSLRADYRGAWYPYVSSGFRIFETLALCEAAGVACVITINSFEDPENMADFVEYCFGDVRTTWGYQRAADGHEQPYKPFTIEIGNEQGLTAEFVSQQQLISTAMVARAHRLKLPFPLQFSIGQNIDMNNFVSPGLNVTLQMLDVFKSLGANVSWDAHIGGDNFADSESFMLMMQRARRAFEEHRSQMRMVVFEENGDTHALQRALVHARMNIVSSHAGVFFLLDTAANGLQVLSQNDNDWDQGQVFMTPDKAWLSPFGWSQWMLKQHVEFDVPLNITKGPEGLDVGAYVSRNGAIGLRVVNWKAAAVNCSITVPLEIHAVPEIEAYELSSSTGDLAEVNSPFDPLRVSPHKSVRGSARLVAGGFIIDWQYQSYSFVTMAIRPFPAPASFNDDVATRSEFVV